MSVLTGFIDKDSHQRLSPDEALHLLREGDIQEMGWVANKIRWRLHPEPVVSYLIDRNINYTNVCVARCKFCNFYRRPGDSQGYTLSKEEVFKKVEETIRLGGTGILMQGGMNPNLKIDFYEDLLSSLRERYQVHLHCFSPPEIVVLAKLSRLSIEETLHRLKKAGLDSIPGGGAEILSDRMRKEISPGKCSSDEWLEVMEVAHREGLKTSATMMFGAGETDEEIIEHLNRIRSVQDRTGGFVAFIPWNVQLKDTEMEGDITRTVSPVEYLRVLSLSRIFLDNFKNIQVSWLTQGLAVGQIALFYGANDVGSIMIEENVVSSAGAQHRATRSDLIELIEQAGFQSVQRDSVFRHLRQFV